MKNTRTVKRESKRTPARRRTEIVRARLSPAEFLLFNRLRDREGMTESAFIRRMLDVHARMSSEAMRRASERAAEEQRKLIEAADRDVQAERNRAEREEIGIRTTANAEAA